MQRAHQREVACFLRQQTGLFVLRCIRISLHNPLHSPSSPLTLIRRGRHLVLGAFGRAVLPLRHADQCLSLGREATRTRVGGALGRIAEQRMQNGEKSAGRSWSRSPERLVGDVQPLQFKLWRERHRRKPPCTKHCAWQDGLAVCSFGMRT